MTGRIEGPQISRGATIEIDIDGRKVTCFPGETIAAVLLANDRINFRRDQYGNPRGPVCNMGVCFECLVTIRNGATPEDTVTECRACMTPVQAGMCVTTGNK